ncbi:hypothetical protein HOLleu_34205 [Holothuria leucospilota]|uniref:Uncharacterized protein n=1 Tax=Holothuria leucospilota TaxID=206669 RepID=A0A9Q0YPX8_HOLLE|nr:hypothetical protein HOLleu_34205 [Holothuria leucospilota]
MPHIERKNPIVFGGGQRSPGVSGGQTLKTLLTQYLEVGSLDEFHTLLSMWMCYGEKMDPIVFGGGQRSSGVTRGKKSKISQEFPRVLHGFTRGQRAKFSKISQDRHLESPEVKTQISQEFPRLNRNTKLYFSYMLR